MSYKTSNTTKMNNKSLLFLAMAASVALLSSCISSRNIASKKPGDSSLIGVWRHVGADVVLTRKPDKTCFDTTRIKLSPLVKVLGKDGEFKNAYMVDSIPRVVEYGTYNVLSPNQYVEYMEKPQTSLPAEKEKVVTYTFLSSKYLVLSDRGSSGSYKRVDLWARDDEGSDSSSAGHPFAALLAAPNSSFEGSLAAVEMPQFPGGDKVLKMFLQANVRYPATSIKNRVQGRVLVLFVVNAEGNIEQAKVIQGVDRYCNQEALRVVNSMPKWIPGKIEGKPVAEVYYTLPIVFKFE
jgi:TonB family protein